MRSILVNNGISNPVINIRQNYRIDLEGDGQDEVLLYAEYAAPDSDSLWGTAGSYSLLLFRKVINGVAENFILAQDVYADNYVQNERNSHLRTTYGIFGFMDLNNDGLMEMVTYDSYWEGFGCTVYEIQGNRPVEVLSNGVSS